MAAGPSSCYERKVAKLIMRREWDEVLACYDRMRCPDAKMNCKGDTVLHLAISDRLLDILDKLLPKLQHDSSMLERVLIAKNENGDTPLHIAANSRYTDYCFGIISSFGRTGKPVQQLVEARNKDGETPLFVAIDHGHKKVFDYLSYYVGSEEEDESGYKWWRKNDATTILHVAILGEHFELASSIIRKYEKLCYARNEKGETPLHVLANMPWAFKTGSPPLPLVEQIIYESTWVSTAEYDYSDAPKMNYPPIYKTCMDLLKLPRQAILAIGNAKRISTGMEARQEEVIGSIRRTNGTPILARRSRFEVLKQKFRRKCPKIIERFMEFLYTHLVVNALVGLCLEMLLTSPLKIGRLIISHFKDVRAKAKRHYWANKVMQQLVQLDDHYYNRWSDTTRRDPYSRISATVENSGKEETKQSTKVENESESTIIEIEREDTMVEIEREVVDIPHMETPILIAARTGITEMVTEILKRFPNAIFDLRQHDQKNLVLIAVENRRIHLWDYFKDKYQEEKYSNWRTLIHMFDKDGNNALHIAAMHSDERPWLMPGEIMKMHWDARWFEYIAGEVPGSFSRKLNKDGKTPKQVFNEVHEEQLRCNILSEWLNTTASSCSVVASLIATVAYASAATVPGGNKDQSGEPHFIGKRRFHIFLITTFTALCFSVSSLVCFLALLVSRQRPSDYSMRLPRSLLWGVSTLSISIAAMLASFCAGQFLYLRGHMLTVLLPIYDVFFALVIIGSIAQFPFFISLLLTVYLNKPQPCYRDEMVR